MRSTRTQAGLARTLAAWLLAPALLIGCGAGGGGSSLTVEVVGLPAGVDADVRVGGEGVARLVRSTTTLALPAGSYDLSAADVERTRSPIVPHERYAPSLSSARVTLSGTATVRATYRNTSSVVLLVPSYVVDSNRPSLRSLSVQDLATGAHAGAGALAGRQLTGAAAGPDGRVLLSDHAGDAVVVVHIGADGDTTVVDEVASFTATNHDLRAPLGLAFDATGDLWVLVSGDEDVPGRLRRFDGDAVSGVDALAGGTLAPTLSVDLPPNGAGAPDPDRADIFSLAVDDGGRLWVVDERGGRLLRYDVPQALAPGAGPDLTLALPAQPTSLVVDAAGRLYVATGEGVARYEAADDPVAPTLLDLGLGAGDRAETLAIDASEALWVGTARGRLLRLLDPAGAVHEERALNWTLLADTSAPTFGGNALFVVAPDR